MARQVHRNERGEVMKIEVADGATPPAKEPPEKLKIRYERKAAEPRALKPTGVRHHWVVLKCEDPAEAARLRKGSAVDVIGGPTTIVGTGARRQETPRPAVRRSQPVQPRAPKLNDALGRALV